MTRKRFLLALPMLTLFLILGVFWWRSQIQVLHLGVYAGSSWDVTTIKNNHVLDEAIAHFEKDHPKVKIVYESGIPREEYSSWLANQILQGSQPDVVMLSSQDFSLLSIRGALMDLTPYINQKEQEAFYPVTLKAGLYQRRQYALPYESNPMLMCVNKDLLDKEGIAIPKDGWTLDEFYDLCQRLTRDTDGDGQLDQFGSTDYGWQEALAAYGGRLIDKGNVRLDSAAMRSALTFASKLQALNQQFRITSKDFDEGKVAFYPMSLAQYRTYKPYPYHVSKYSKFHWTCIPLPARGSGGSSTLVDTSLFAVSAQSKHKQLAVEFIKYMTEHKGNQQELFNQSQGLSVLPHVVTSTSSQSLLKEDDFGEDALTTQTLDRLMKHSVEQVTIGLSPELASRITSLLDQTIQNQEDIDSQLPRLQREVDTELRSLAP